jgi:plastocyanin
MDVMAHRRLLAARLVPGLGAALVVLALAAGSVLAADHAVAISGFSFSPASITVTTGDTVTWTNSDAQAHTATADGASFDTGPITNGNSATVTFSTAGTFAYHCSIHPQMTGSVTVQDAPAPTPTPAPTSPPGPGATPRPTTPPTDVALGDESSPMSGSAIALVLVGGLWVLAFAVARRQAAHH